MSLNVCDGNTVKFHETEVIPGFSIQFAISIARGSVGRSFAANVSNGAMNPSLFLQNFFMKKRPTRKPVSLITELTVQVRFTETVSAASVLII